MVFWPLISPGRCWSPSPLSWAGEASLSSTCHALHSSPDIQPGSTGTHGGGCPHSRGPGSPDAFTCAENRVPQSSQNLGSQGPPWAPSTRLELPHSPDMCLPGSLLQAPWGWEGPYWLLTPVTGLDSSETDAQQAFINPTHDHEGAASCQAVAQDSTWWGCRDAGWPPATSWRRPGYQIRN